MIVRKFYEFIINHKYIEVHGVIVTYYPNDECIMTGYLNSDNIVKIADIINRYRLKLIHKEIIK